jgi:Tfp pilus assembly protein PilP
MKTTRVSTAAFALASIFAFGIALAGRPGQAQVQEPGTPEAAVKNTAPNLGGVKAVVKDAVKEVAAKVPGQAAAAPAPSPAPGATAAAAAAPQDASSRAVMLRKKTLREEDFVEDERNRDPFRSYLRLFTSKEAPQLRKVPAIFEKFALEELALIAIVSGDANPRAMFRDPGGLGQTVKRGDYVSKAGARISKILSDRVILELNELTPNGETRVLEKAILVNPEAAQK